MDNSALPPIESSDDDGVVAGGVVAEAAPDVSVVASSASGSTVAETAAVAPTHRLATATDATAVGAAVASAAVAAVVRRTRYLNIEEREQRHIQKYVDWVRCHEGKLPERLSRSKWNESTKERRFEHWLYEWHIRLVLHGDDKSAADLKQKLLPILASASTASTSPDEAAAAAKYVDPTPHCQVVSKILCAKSMQTAERYVAWTQTNRARPRQRIDARKSRDVRKQEPVEKQEEHFLALWMCNMRKAKFRTGTMHLYKSVDEYLSEHLGENWHIPPVTTAHHDALLRAQSVADWVQTHNNTLPRISSSAPSEEQKLGRWLCSYKSLAKKQKTLYPDVDAIMGEVLQTALPGRSARNSSGGVGVGSGGVN